MDQGAAVSAQGSGDIALPLLPRPATHPAPGEGGPPLRPTAHPAWASDAEPPASLIGDEVQPPEPHPGTEPPASLIGDEVQPPEPHPGTELPASLIGTRQRHLNPIPGQTYQLPSSGTRQRHLNPILGNVRTKYAPIRRAESSSLTIDRGSDTV